MADEGGSADNPVERPSPDAALVASAAVQDDVGAGVPRAGVLNAVDAIKESPGAWEFFAAVRALQAARGNQPPVGRSTRIDQDFLRFKQEPTLAFQSAELMDFKDAENTRAPAWEMRQVFFGFFGPNGPLPTHITEDAIADMRDSGRHRLLPDFCDILQHRMTSLLYRAWESTQITASRDLGGDDPYKRRIGAFYGEALPAFIDRETLSDDTKRYISGHLSARRGSVAALEAVVGTIIGATAQVDQYVGEWLPIPIADRSRMGTARLGVDTTIGDRAFSAQSRIAIRTARLDFEEYETLLPDGEVFGQLRDAVRHVLGIAMAWELRPILKVSEIPKCSLDGNRRLGWDTWMSADERMQDGNELALEGTLGAA